MDVQDRARLPLRAEGRLPLRACIPVTDTVFART